MLRIQQACAMHVTYIISLNLHNTHIVYVLNTGIREPKQIALSKIKSQQESSWRSPA